MTSGNLWRSLEKSIEADIRSGTFMPGDKLPTEAQLARRFMVNRHTVRRALSALRDKDLVESVQGRGTFVRRPALRYTIGKRTRFSDVMRKQAVRSHSETRSIDLMNAPREAADALGIKPRAKVVLLRRMGFADNIPISLSSHYFSYDRLPLFEEFYRRRNSVSATLADCGIPEFFRQKTLVHAQVPSIEECELLHVPRHVPLLQTRAWNVDGLGRPLEYGEALFASDRVDLEIVAEQLPKIDFVNHHHFERKRMSS